MNNKFKKMLIIVGVWAVVVIMLFLSYMIGVFDTADIAIEEIKKERQCRVYLQRYIRMKNSSSDRSGLIFDKCVPLPYSKNCPCEGKELK